MISAKKNSFQILQLLKKEYPDSKCALDYKGTWQLLVAVILSAQCTDKRVNIVTKSLFKKYKSVDDVAKTKQKDFEEDIRSTGFYRNKAKNIRATAKKVKTEFKGSVPKTMEELLSLPGVARKTANVILNEGFGIREGIAVDTHVTRLTNRLGLTKQKNPVKIEEDLKEIVPQNDWGAVTLLLIDHGRAICNARKPLCHECCLLKLCPTGRKLK